MCGCRHFSLVSKGTDTYFKTFEFIPPKLEEFLVNVITLVVFVVENTIAGAVKLEMFLPIKESIYSEEIIEF